MFYKLIAALKEGKAEFDNLIVSAKPGSEGIKIVASSKAIDTTMIRSIFGDIISNNTIELSFRYCKPGEQVLGDS